MDKAKYVSKIAGHALVLGGSGGIGSEIVRALVAHGARAVTFTYGRNKDVAEALKAEVEAEGVKVYIGSPDLADQVAFSDFLNDAVIATGEEVSVAVNSVGVSPDTPYEEQTPELWREVYNVNVVACQNSSMVIALRMQQRSIKGSIVWVTSTNGINSHSSFSAPYDASKAAQILAMRIMAEHFAPFGIRVNGVAPGWINTKMNDTVPAEDMKHEIAKIWSNRMADPTEVAMLVAFVAGSGGSYINGQNIMIDGGYR